MEKEHSKPNFSRSIGSFRVSVWENPAGEDGKDGKVWWNVSVLRRWMTKTGEWQESGTLNGLGDIALAACALKCAERYIIARQKRLDWQEEVAEQDV